ncbi:hypothetical protein VCHA53O466_140002 [Vibrio chagasii]|nr:hypothetical protein VCHA53O466_140002 [Vibrio chagasii]
MHTKHYAIRHKTSKEIFKLGVSVDAYEDFGTIQTSINCELTETDGIGCEWITSSLYYALYTFFYGGNGDSNTPIISDIDRANAELIQYTDVLGSRIYEKASITNLLQINYSTVDGHKPSCYEFCNALNRLGIKERCNFKAYLAKDGESELCIVADSGAGVTDRLRTEIMDEYDCKNVEFEELKDCNYGDWNFTKVISDVHPVAQRVQEL